MKLLLKIMYDGSAYAGYQAQPCHRTVQGTLTEAVSECLGFQCTVTGCSRTDAGVHALGFCCAVEPAEQEMRSGDWLKIPIGRFHRALSDFLPDDISVCGEAEALGDFHPRYNVKSKEYVYRMYDSPYENPFLRGRAWHLKKSVSDEGISRMRAAGGYIIGKHDFTSFMASGSKITDPVRTVYSLSVDRNDGIIEIRVSADGFLYNMVRIIVGTLSECAAGKIEPHSIADVIDSRDRAKSGRTAPPDGLYLSEVCYDRKINWKIL